MNQPGELSEKNGLGFLAALQEPEPWGWDTAWYEVVCILCVLYYINRSEDLKDSTSRHSFVIKRSLLIIYLISELIVLTKIPVYSCADLTLSGHTKIVRRIVKRRSVSFHKICLGFQLAKRILNLVISKAGKQLFAFVYIG